MEFPFGENEAFECAQRTRDVRVQAHQNWTATGHTSNRIQYIGWQKVHENGRQAEEKEARNELQVWVPEIKMSKLLISNVDNRNH